MNKSINNLICKYICLIIDFQVDDMLTHSAGSQDLCKLQGRKCHRSKQPSFIPYSIAFSRQFYPVKMHECATVYIRKIVGLYFPTPCVY